MTEYAENNRRLWLCYMLGYMVGAGWRIPREDVESFKLAFPEIPERHINQSIEEIKAVKVK